MNKTEKVALAMAWYDSGLENRAAFHTLMKSLLTQPEQEPVAWMCNAFDGKVCEQSNHDECENPIPLYTTPPKREWVGLTDNERAECWSSSAKQSAINIEAKLKEKNT